ncbi:hypothetical protein [Paraburkholderia dilworthii]|nr:hypothetical protein [Paraburkholderia dilworthii]
MPVQFEQHGKAFRRVLIVIHYDDAATGRCRIFVDRKYFLN